MGHNHSHHSHHHHTGSNIKLAFFLNLGFTLLEIVGGIATNSVAILSDALHDLGDSLSLGLAWFLDKYSKKKENGSYTYGYRRYSLLAALINTTVLIVGSFIVLSQAIPRLFNPESPDARGMIGFAILGIIVNGIAAYKTSGGASLNEKIVSWHLLEDVLGWVAVLIVGIIMYFREIDILDPILSIGITLYILYNVAINFKKTILLFLQAVPEGIDVNEIVEKFMEIDKVVDTHHTHIWSLDSEHHVMSTHIVIEADSTMEDIKRVKELAKESVKDMGMEHVTIEIGIEGEHCDMAD